MKVRKKISVAYWIIWLLQGCNNQSAISPINKQFVTDTIVKDIPLTRNGELIGGYNFVNEMTKKLNLDDITNGFDSIQIRIWYSYARGDSNQLVLLKNNGNNWEAKLYTYTFLEANGRIDTISTFLMGYPKSGWEYFVSQLYKLGVSSLPNMDKLMGDSIIILHGDIFTVEYATKRIYRLYQYKDPSNYMEKWSDANKMEHILQLIEQELEFKRLRVPIPNISDAKIEMKDVRFE